MKIAMVCGKKILHVFFGYNYSMLQKRVGLRRKRGSFLRNYWIIIIHDVPEKDILIVAGDMNCHIGSTRDGFEDFMGCFSFGVRNQEGENMLGLCQGHKLRV